jgi:hypothetical protein
VDLRQINVFTSLPRDVSALTSVLLPNAKILRKSMLNSVPVPLERKRQTNQTHHTHTLVEKPTLDSKFCSTTLQRTTDRITTIFYTNISSSTMITKIVALPTTTATPQPWKLSQHYRTCTVDATTSCTIHSVLYFCPRSFLFLTVLLYSGAKG